MQGVASVKKQSPALFGVSSWHSAHRTLEVWASLGVGVTLAFYRKGGGLGTRLLFQHKPFPPASPWKDVSLLSVCDWKCLRTQVSLG